MRCPRKRVNSTPPSTSYSATSGVAQKGPLILGSTISAQELTASLAPTGKQYSYQTNSDLGTFNPNSSFTSPYIGLNATGYYFDEVANSLSTGTVTLNGYSDLSAVNVLNVNLLTTLTYQRIANLVSKSSMTFAAAHKQAESEVLAALNIPNGSSYGPFDTLDISKNTDGDKLLAALSSVFVYGNSSASLSALLASFQNDIGTNGKITTPATATTLMASAKALNPATVAANLTTKYSSVGVSFSASDISNWIDQDGDGLVGKFKFQVPNATQSSTFQVPAFVTDPNAGSSVSTSQGQLSVNGAAVNGSATINTGDSVSVAPPPGTFPNGIEMIYLLAGTTRIARVTFIAGLDSIAVTPANPTVQVGATQQLTATATYSDGSHANVSANAAWSSDATTIAMVGAASGLVTGAKAGSAVITAAVGSISGTTNVTVTPPTLQSISLTPSPFSTGVGIARRLTATGSYSDGSSANVSANVVWSSSDSSAATVTGGLVTGIALGSTTVSAAFGSVSASISVSVTSNAWSQVASTGFPRAGHTATLLPDGRVLVDAGFVSNSAEIFDPSSGKWSPTAPTDQIPMVDHTATLLPSGKVLIAGGWQDGGAFTTYTDIYDPASDRWSIGATMTVGRFAHTATLLPNGTVLATGGCSSAGGICFPGSSAEIYDPVANSWTATPTMSNQHAFHTATLLPNGKVLIAAGGCCTGSPTNTAEIYDPTLKTWTTVASLNVGREAHTATLLGNGTVLVAGGSTNTTNTATVEIYDPTTNTWSLVASMTFARAGHTATLLPNGRVLVSGGTGSGSGAEIYDPVANSWSPTGPMVQARPNTDIYYRSTATFLSNGTSLVVGGLSAAQAAISVCEEYW